MNTSSQELAPQPSAAHRRVESGCQALVDAGAAWWQINADGATELHMRNGEAYLFGAHGVTRLK